MFIDCELSKKHQVSEVIKHLLSLCRKSKDVKDKVKFNAKLCEPEAFELRLVNDEDSDSSEYSKNKQYYKAEMDFPALSRDQMIGEYSNLVLIEKKNWNKLKKTN